MNVTNQTMRGPLAGAAVSEKEAPRQIPTELADLNRSLAELSATVAAVESRLTCVIETHPVNDDSAKNPPLPSGLFGEVISAHRMVHELIGRVAALDKHLML